MQGMSIPAINGYAQIGSGLGESQYESSLNLATLEALANNTSGVAKRYKGGYLDIPGSVSSSSTAVSMANSTFASGFGTCARRHDSGLTADAVSRCSYWPDCKSLNIILIS